jgi:hypothetical protein
MAYLPGWLPAAFQDWNAGKKSNLILSVLIDQTVLNWLLEGDVSIQFQVKRDLLGILDLSLQKRIEKEGWGQLILSKRHKNGIWGERFYQPKWISTHYTLLDLRNLNLPQNNPLVKSSIEQVLMNNKALDGGIQLGPSTHENSDICVNGMFLNYASYFKTDESKLKSIIDSILKEQMDDGGYNCESNQGGAQHSSLHSTISILEGFQEFLYAGYTYRKSEILNSINKGIEFILIHHLFKSDKTGAIIHKDFLKLTYPCRWKYDVLRALDFMQYAKIPYDSRMDEALEFLNSKKNKNGLWPMQAAHPGQVHLVMEPTSKASKWNTLRALKVLQFYPK